MGASAEINRNSDAKNGVAPVKLAHVVLRSNNFEHLIEWYSKVILAHATYANEMVAFMTYDEEHHRVAILNTGKLKKSPEMYVGVDHFAFTYASLEDLLRNWERLKSLGIEPFWCINHGPTTSMYYRDPDNNEIELQVDNYDTIEETSAFFQTEAFAKNPIGVDFDPALLLRKLEEGVPVAELIKQGSAPVAPGKEVSYDRLSGNPD